MKIVLDTHAGPKLIKVNVVDINEPLYSELGPLKSYAWNIFFVQIRWKLQENKQISVGPVFMVIYFWNDRFHSQICFHTLNWNVYICVLCIFLPWNCSIYCIVRIQRRFWLKPNIVIDISKAYDSCQKNCTQPLMILARSLDDTTFKKRVLMDLMFFDWLSVPPSIDNRNIFSAGQSWTAMDSNTIWNNFLLLKVKLYMGNLSQVHIDNRSDFNSHE